MKKVIAFLLILSTTLFFGCNLEFVDPNASAGTNPGGSVIVKPNGGTTGGTTSGGSSSSGGTTTKPDSGTTGGNTSGGSSSSGGTTTKPDSGTTGGNTSGGSSSSGGTTTKPDSGTTGGTTSGGSSSSGSTTTKPDSGTTGGNTSGGSSSSGGTTTKPDSGTTGGTTSGGSSSDSGTTTKPDSGTTGGNTSDGTTSGDSSSDSGTTTKPDSGTSDGTTSGDSSSSGGTTTVPDDKPVTPAEPTYSTDINFVYTKLKAAFDAFSARSSYKTTMSGETVATGYTQTINSTVYHANGLWQSDYQSNSLVVNFYHHVYIKGSNVVYSHSTRENGGTLEEKTLSWYRQNYGVAPFDHQLGGYVVDLTSILNASYQKDANGKVTFVISVDGNKSTDMLVQMVEFGGLAATPTFSKLTFTVVCENGTDISSYDTSAEYTIKKVILWGNPKTMSATMKLTTTISDYNGTVTYPSV